MNNLWSNYGQNLFIIKALIVSTSFYWWYYVQIRSFTLVIFEWADVRVQFLFPEFWKMASGEWHCEKRDLLKNESFTKESGNVPDTGCLSIIVLGASGDLAKKKTFPALFNLYRQVWFEILFAFIFLMTILDTLWACHLIYWIDKCTSSRAVR